MKVLLSWVRDFVDVPDSAEEIGRRLSLRGLALEGLEAHGDDTVLDFDVTANRPDCLSMLGIAREIATVYGLPLKDVGRDVGRDFSPAAGAGTKVPRGGRSAPSAAGAAHLHSHAERGNDGNVAVAANINQ